ncbi:MAG: tRNA dihydrouridine synthase DusB [Clostridiales bacterium]|nr:tRNA dihydrouridine synthase DusB [Clostridiales bacterium]
MKIGGLQVNGRALLAPMAGVGDQAFRELCVSFGAALATGEMVSSKGLCYHDKKTASLLALSDEERPAGVQLFGDDPDCMAQSVELAMQYRPDFIDINMGCPAPKITSNGCGSALMKQPELCERIVRAVVRESPVPVTVKIRKGWNDEMVNAVEVALRCEAAGAAAVTVHGRTREQMYAPSADWDIIRQVKQAVKVPVIGNGDVVSPESAARMLETTGCDAVMIGRAAEGAPWIFQRVNAWLEHETMLPEPPVTVRMQVMLRHIKRMCELKGEGRAMREARHHASCYMRGLHGAPGLRRESGTLTTFEDAQRLACHVLELNGGESDGSK